MEDDKSSAEQNVVITKTKTEDKFQKRQTKKVNKVINRLKRKFATHLENGKSQVVALILAIFVGAVGIHRMYLGYIGIGIIQLLTLGGCGIWALIDIIRIAMGGLKPNGGIYSKTL